MMRTLTAYVLTRLRAAECRRTAKTYLVGVRGRGRFRGRVRVKVRVRARAS